MTSATSSPPSPHVAVVAHREKLRTRDAKRLCAALHDAGYEHVPWIEIAHGSQGTNAGRKALKTGAQVVLACGGDGTVRAVAQALVGREAALAVFPTGTANLFAGGFSLPSDATSIVELIRAGTTRTIDTGDCNGMTFGVMAGVGFDAAMIDGADASKERLGMLAYLRAGVHEARAQHPFAAKVVVDGTTFFHGDATCVLVGNIGTLKGGLEAFPDASVTDGVLDVAVITAAGVREWASLMIAAVRRKQRASGHVLIGRGVDVNVELDHKRTFELDGGSKGKTRALHLSARPHSLVLCSPAPT